MSLRTLSMLGSRVSTPRYGTLNSHRDLYAGMAAESRTLDRSSTFDRSQRVDRSRSGIGIERSTSVENSRPRYIVKEERPSRVTSPVSLQTFGSPQLQQQTVHNGGTRDMYQYPVPKSSPATVGYVDMNHRGTMLFS